MRRPLPRLRLVDVAVVPEHFTVVRGDTHYRVSRVALRVDLGEDEGEEAVQVLNLGRIWVLLAEGEMEVKGEGPEGSWGRERP